MEDMISKELLSEVMGQEIRELGTIIIDDLSYFSVFWRAINIYQLAHKCKEWAWDNGYGMNITRSLLHDMYGTTIFYKNGAFSSSGGLADTEPEAIFKACDWILKEKR